MKKLIHFIFAEEPFEITYDVPLDTAVDRLKSVVKKVPIIGFDTKGMAGKVNEKSVRIISLDSGFRKVIAGSFKSDGNKTIFSGVFRHNRFSQVFMSFWFGFILVFTLVALFLAITKPSEAWFLPLFCIFMFFFGVGIVKIRGGYFRNEKTWLFENISKTINGNS